MANEQNTDRIEQYLLGKLGANEKAQFESQLLVDPELKKELKLQEEIIAAFQEKKLENILMELDEGEVLAENNEEEVEELQAKKRPLFLRYGRFLAAAAVGALLFMFWPRMSLEEQLFEEHNRLWSSGMRSSGSETPATNQVKNTFQEAYFFCRKKKYEESIELLKKSLNDETYKRQRGDASFLLLGYNYMNLDPPNLSEAIKYFEEVDSKRDTLGRLADWYKGLAYLKAEDKDKAIAAFQLVRERNDRSKEFDRAGRILEKLKE
ncbi:MAG: hypothetical protein AAF696_27840 [Bacteroidota bacterium]